MSHPARQRTSLGVNRQKNGWLSISSVPFLTVMMLFVRSLFWTDTISVHWTDLSNLITCWRLHVANGSVAIAPMRFSLVSGERPTTTPADADFDSSTSIPAWIVANPGWHYSTHRIRELNYTRGEVLRAALWPKIRRQFLRDGPWNCWNWLIAIPVWPLLLLAGIAPARRLAASRRRLRRARAGYCLNCGYDLRATLDTCPECGTKAAQS